MLEKTIEEILKRYPNEVWPDLRLTYIESQRRLPNGKILDLCFRDDKDNYWIVELKRSRVTLSTIRQLVGYIDELRELEPDTTFQGMAAGLYISEAASKEARHEGFSCRQISETRLREIAAKHGLPVDHESGHRPLKTGTNQVVSRPLPSKNRPPTDPDVVEQLRALDSEFPPGSLNYRSGLKTIEAYWRMACSNSPENLIKIAAQLSRTILGLVHTCAISNRSPGPTDSYTTIRSLDGRVAAAIDARRRSVKLDFPLPSELATECVEKGELRISRPRGYSMWVQSSVGTKLSIERAGELLREGLSFEFREQFRAQ